MTTLDLSKLDPEVREELAKKASPAHVAQYCTRHLPDDSESKWLPFDHHLYMNRRLVEAATETARSFLNMSISVRHGKTALCTMWFPIWFMGMFPDRSIVLVSHTARKAEAWGWFCMNVMKRYGMELFGLQVDPERQARGQWGLKDRRGTMLAVGVGTAIEGEGIDLGVMDDPLTPEGARSPAVLEDTWEWYTEAFRPRLMPGSTVVLVMSRYGELDLAGRIISQQAESPGSDPWRHVVLPAIAEEPRGAALDGRLEGPVWVGPDAPLNSGLDPQQGPPWRDEMGRLDGEALWPERWPTEDLLQTRRSVGEPTWRSRYQQDPTPREGGMFKVDDWRITPHRSLVGLSLVRVWDLAASENTGDWTTGVLLGMDGGGRIYVLDVQMVQKGSAGVRQLIRDTAVNDGTHVPVIIEQERAGAGKAQVADYKREMVGWVVDGVKPEGSKEQRAAPWASQQQVNNVWLLQAEWNATFIEQHRVFPKGRHDDIVDACAHGLQKLAAGGFTTVIAEEILEVDLDRMFDLATGGRLLNLP